MNFAKNLLVIAGAATLALSAFQSVQAADGSWNVDAAGNWVDGANWLGSVVPGATSGTTNTDIATFGFALTADRTVTVDANRNIGGITFSFGDEANINYTLAGADILLTNGGTIQNTGSTKNNSGTTANIIIQGENGTGNFVANNTHVTSRLIINSIVSGVSSAGNVTTAILDGASAPAAGHVFGGGNDGV